MQEELLLAHSLTVLAVLVGKFLEGGEPGTVGCCRSGDRKTTLPRCLP